MAYDKPPQDPIVFTHRDIGAAGFNVSLPNSYERMWMVGRAINFDMTNYNKLYSNPDKALKKRYMKNVMRLIDNPLSYIIWHSYPYLRSGKIKILPLYFFIMYGSAFLANGRQRHQGATLTAYEKMWAGHERFEYPVEVHSKNHNLAFNFHDHEFSANKGMVSQKAAPPFHKFVRLNNYVRDQNLRKYFAHRELRGVDPFTGKPK